MKHRIIFTALAIASVVGAAPAQAEWPQRTVTVIVPFPAGGGTDTFARPLAAQLSQQLGQSVVIDNKGGAGGTLGAGVAARAKADGYTFFMGGAHHALAPSLYRRLNYDIQKDFKPVALLAQPPQVIVVNKNQLPVNTLVELVEYTRANNGAINVGNAGKGSTHHLAGVLFAMQNGLNVMDVPYQGAGPMLTALMGGQVDVAFDGLGSSAGHIRAGNLRPLAVAAAQRSPSFPDVPTVAETGLPDFQVSTWYALWAPAGTPDAVVARMEAEINKALQSPKVKEIWQTNGSTIPQMTRAQFGEFVDQEIDRWADVVKESGVVMD